MPILYFFYLIPINVDDPKMRQKRRSVHLVRGYRQLTNIVNALLSDVQTEPKLRKCLVFNVH